MLSCRLMEKKTYHRIYEAFLSYVVLLEHIVRIVYFLVDVFCLVFVISTFHFTPTTFKLRMP